MHRPLALAVFAALVPAIIAAYPPRAAAKNPKPDLTFVGEEAVVRGLPCTAPYTSKSIGTTLCSVYSGTISGPALGKRWSAAMINLTITRAGAGDTNPIGCHGMYLNIQFSNGSDMRTMYGFGSVCGPDNDPLNYQKGADLIGTGGWAAIDSNGNGTGLGTFVTSFTPEKGAAGDNLVITFQNAPQGQ